MAPTLPYENPWRIPRSRPNTSPCPLGAEEVRKAKQNLGWPQEPAFHLPDEALTHFRSAIDRGRELEEGWKQKFDAYERAFPELAREIDRRLSGELPDGWADALPSFPADAKGLATRKASEVVMQAVARTVPEVVGGSGDLDPSTYTWLEEAGDFESPLRSQRSVQGLVGGGWGYGGRNIHFGVREHAMAAAVNGLALHGGFIPFAATFLVFSDYTRPSIRLAALAELLRRGAYVLNPFDRGDPDVILIASGSEVALIVAAGAILRKVDVNARLVSMPSWRLFEEQSAEYRESVLPTAVTARLAVEAASPLGWERWTGLGGAVLGIDRFGASAPGGTVFEKYGFTADHVVAQALAVAGRRTARESP